ncbi:hypothetical protein [Enemella sp. A6]|uniref:hypothetical protein n=1 Tax=Enemella sp. A6 TaxID=3440152 RepID=UPI003EB991F8
MESWGWLERWAVAMCAAAGLGVLAMVTNITTDEQLSGQADAWLTARSFLSNLVNSGTVWGGLLVLAGWLVRHRWQAMVAGVLAGELALFVHYGLAEACGPLLPVAQPGFEDNGYWFVAAAIFGAPLGLIGALAHRAGRVGVVATLVVPIGAIIEPFFLGQFTRLAMVHWPTHVSSFLSGVVLVVAGLMMTVKVLRGRASEHSSEHESPHVPV